MLTQVQDAIIYLMFLNGVLFLGLNFIAYSIVFPGPKGSKRIGYVLIVAALLAFMAQQEYRILIYLDFPPGIVRQVLLGGCIVPVFLVSAVYYRTKKNRMEKDKQLSNQPEQTKNGND